MKPVKIWGICSVSKKYYTAVDRPARNYEFTFAKFLGDKLFSLVLLVILEIALVLFLVAFRLELIQIILIAAFPVVFWLGEFLFEFFRRKSFYNLLIANLVRLDQAYLILETLEKPGFLDGKIFYETLYDVNKSATEKVAAAEAHVVDFREYIELWVHEAKTPLTTLGLMSHTPAITEQLHRLDDYVEQVLFFARAENAERDYHIAETLLASVISEVALENREIFNAKHIDLNVRNLQIKVATDAKWLKFIIGQIIANSIKYRSSRLEIFAIETPQDVTLKIIDNGIGISAKDLPRVFEKSFTGENGHLGTKNQNSTGMGLYIVKTLCDKLGHEICLTSEQGRWTAAEIVFHKHDYYDITKK